LHTGAVDGKEGQIQAPRGSSAADVPPGATESVCTCRHLRL